MKSRGNKIDDMKSDLVSSHNSIMTSVNNFTSAVIRIRDILRKTAISGMESMRHICLYLMARQVTRQTVLDLDVPIKFAWENIIEMMHTQEGGEQYALEFFYHPEEDCLVQHFDRLFGTEKFSFDIKNLKTHKEILEILDRIDLSKVDSQMDILGWVYEQHLKTGAGSGGRDLGQFFTDRTICEYMVSLCRPVFKRAGVPESVCDPSMGTGGFLTSFIKYYKKHHSETPINWKIQQKEIHGCDNDPRVAGIARMNLFMETGGSRPTNLRTHDSLHGDLTQTGYDVILANEPFGLKGLKHADCCERVKQLKIRGTKSEPLFLQLMMVSLNQGGRCAVVVPDGMLVNTSELHDGTRKYLLDHFELKRVIKMRGQFFMNTGIQPSILFFENTGNPTTAVEFWDVIKSANGSIEETMVLSVPRDKLDASCSLDMRRYQEVKEVANLAGYPMVKLGDLYVQPQKVNKFNAGEMDNIGNIPFYSAKWNSPTGTHSVPSYKSNKPYFVVIKSGGGDHTSDKVGLGMIFNVCGEIASSVHVLLLEQREDIQCTFLHKYIDYYMKCNIKELRDKAKKSINLEVLSIGDIMDFPIHLPPLPIQQEIVATLDRIYAPGTTELADTLKLTNQAMDLVLAQPNGVTLEPIVEVQRLMRKSAQMVADVKAQMVADVKAQMVAIVKSVESRGFTNVKLGDIIQKTGSGKTNSTSISNTGEYPFYGCTTVVPSGTHSSYDFDDSDYLLFAKSGGNAKNPISSSMGIGKFHHVKGRSSGNVAVYQYKIKSDKIAEITYPYLTYILRMNLHKFQALAKYTTGNGNIDVNDALDVTMPLPPLNFQQEVITRLDALQSQLIALENLGKQAEDNARFILESYLQSHTESPYSSEAVWNSHEETLVNEVVEESSSAAASSAISAPRPLKMKKPAVSKK
jgi:restriction endonuclease S subunit